MKQLLATARSYNIEVWADGDSLHFRHTGTPPVNRHVLDMLKAHKMELLAHFATQAEQVEQTDPDVEPRPASPSAPRAEHEPTTATQPPPFIIPQRPANLPSFCAGHDCRHFRLYRIARRPPEPWCHWWSADRKDWRNDAVRPDRMRTCPKQDYLQEATT